MSDASTRYMMQRYSDEAPAPRFLTSLFSNQVYFDTEEVELDVERDTEDVAIVIQDLSVGTRKNEAGKFTNKSFKPPIYNEEFTLTAFDLNKRVPGQHPFENPDFAANAANRVFSGARKLHNKVSRAIELQASQALINGELILIDDAGVALFSLDFQPKSSHFTTPTAWAADGSTGAPLTNFTDLARLLRRDGRKSPKKAIFGGGAFTRFMANAAVKANLASIGMQQLISLQRPQAREDGSSFIGYFSVDSYLLEIWLYDAVYKHPQTGVITPYVPDNKVLLVPEGADLRIAFGSIPRIVPPDPRVAQFIPDSLRGPGFGLSPYVWVTPDGLHVKVSVGSRPLVIPTAIDTFGTITAF
jgi:hypothetical protein